MPNTRSIQTGAGNGGEVYKIGVTNSDITTRFSLNELHTIRVVKTWGYAVGLDAYLVEQHILKEFAEYKYKGPQLLKTGNTELFTKDILLLDT
jgi:hypothetical protein